MKVGITEAGDAGLDLGWVNKLGRVDAAVLITKSLNQQFCRALLAVPTEKIILHHTVTGWGRWALEPNVASYETELARLQKLLAMGFPAERVVVRVDPIIPSDEGLHHADSVIAAVIKSIPTIKRIRVSVFDQYPHVVARFNAAGVALPYPDGVFQASNSQMSQVDSLLAPYSNQVTFECCAEPRLTIPQKRGCISSLDYQLWECNTSPEDYSPVRQQRKACLCIGEKIELLKNKKQCPHGCVYCYWQSDCVSEPTTQLSL